MNRRFFLRTSIPTGVLVAGAPSLLTMEGCDSATLKSYLNTVLDAAEKILALSSSTESWFTTLTKAIAALKATESNWSGSTAVAAVISALDTLEAVLAVIPLTSVYSVLIDLLVSVIDTILTTFVSATAPAAIPKAMAMANAHRGRISLKKPHLFQSKVGAFKQQWNDLVSANPDLTKAKL